MRGVGREVGRGLGGGLGCKGGKGNKGVHRLRIGSWNVGSLTGKSIELAKILKKRRVNIGVSRRQGGQGRVRGTRMGINFGTLEPRRCTVNVVSAYAPHVGLDEEVKRRFWEGLDEIIRQVAPTEKLFIGGDFNGHIGSTAGVYDEREEHLVTFQNAVAKTQIDYLLLRRRDRGLCKDCKVIPGEILVTRHRLLVMDVGIMVKRRKMSARERPRIRWGALTKDKAQELEGRLSVI
ncbi:PREDICTED: uncharacterized protein LOC109238858 [Nicotiana attenuata]|uniref:uncharacterized protein LOC109238858 n=1 Tax=Nicotiana attenuata TaxID=49451 RepID=UPI00090530D1|nr:PREDICTED: uncharacterized protein LOC109238858 [Nicotiana attenuata]